MNKLVIVAGLLFAVRVAHADGLDRTSIASGISQVKPKVLACGQNINTTGTIKVTVTVGPDGKVTSAKRVSGDAQLGACVVDAIKTATFKPSKSGGTFSYPFVFSGPPPATPPAAGAAAPPPVGESLDRDAIETGIAAIKAKVAACGDKIKATGKIKVSISVGPDGKVTKAARTDGDEKLGACVVDVMKTAMFKASKTGGSFSYPFVFGAPSPSPAGPPSVPNGVADAGTALDRTMIQDGIAAVRTKISDCGKTSAAKGTVKIKVAVAPAGTVTSAEVQAAPDPALGTCVAGVLKKSTFAKTDKGGAFSYPFVF